MARRQMDEVMSWILHGPVNQKGQPTGPSTLADQIARAKTVKTNDPAWWGFMLLACQQEYRITCLPEGLPDTVKIDRNAPQGMSQTALRNEFRKIRNFIPGGPYEKIQAWRRESIWVQILEGVHFREVDFITHVKDQTLLGLYPELVEILPAIGIEITIPLGVSETTEEPATEPEVVVSEESSTDTEVVSSTDTTESEKSSTRKSKGKKTKPEADK